MSGILRCGMRKQSSLGEEFFVQSRIELNSCSRTGRSIKSIWVRDLHRPPSMQRRTVSTCLVCPFSLTVSSGMICSRKAQGKVEFSQSALQKPEVNGGSRSEMVFNGNPNKG